jgi:hypothetical protein
MAAGCAAPRAALIFRCATERSFAKRVHRESRCRHEGVARPRKVRAGIFVHTDVRPPCVPGAGLPFPERTDLPKPNPRKIATVAGALIAIVAAVALNGAAPRFIALARGENARTVALDSMPAGAPSPAAGEWKNPFPQWNGNKRLPEHPVPAAQSQQMMDTLYADSPTLTGPGLHDDSESFWTASNSDPLHTIHCTNRWGPKNGPCLLEGRQIHVPDGALAAQNSDHHTSILQPDGCTSVDLWIAQDMAAPTITAAFAAQHDQCTENGFNTHGGAGTTAGGASNRLGHSPLAELKTGVIHHAVIAFAGCDLTDAFVGQAIYPGQFQACRPGVKGVGIPMGAYFWSDVRPADLPSTLDNATRMLCVALNAYGALMNDTNGNWHGISLGAFWAGNGRDDEYPHGPRTNDDPDGYASWFAQNAGPNGVVDPAACFPNGDWSHHIHVLAW